MRRRKSSRPLVDRESPADREGEAPQPPPHTLDLLRWLEANPPPGRRVGQAEPAVHTAVIYVHGVGHHGNGPFSGVVNLAAGIVMKACVYSHSRARAALPVDAEEFWASLKTLLYVMSLLSTGLDSLSAGRRARGVLWRLAFLGAALGSIAVAVCILRLYFGPAWSAVGLLWEEVPRFADSFRLTWTTIWMPPVFGVVVLLTCVIHVLPLALLGFLPTSLLDLAGDVGSYCGSVRRFREVHRALSATVNAIRRLHPGARLVLVGHSLGGLIALEWMARRERALLRAATLLVSPRSDGAGPPIEAETRAAGPFLVTMGTPAGYLSRVFPHVVRRARRSFLRPTGSPVPWLNLWHRWDYIGRTVLAALRPSRVDACVGGGGHGDYAGDPAVEKAIGEFVRGVAVEDRSVGWWARKPLLERLGSPGAFVLGAVLALSGALAWIGTDAVLSQVERLQGEVFTWMRAWSEEWSRPPSWLPRPR